MTITNDNLPLQELSELDACVVSDVLLNFMVITIQRLKKKIVDEIHKLLNPNTPYGSSNKLPLQFILNAVSKFEINVDDKLRTTVSQIVNKSLGMRHETQNISTESVNDAIMLIDIRSELYALHKIYEWRFHEKHDGIIVFIPLNVHNFIPLALRMGYNAQSIQLFNVTLNQQKKGKMFKINKAPINYDKVLAMEIMNASGFSERDSNHTLYTKKKKKIIEKDFVDHISIFGVKHISKEIHLFESELVSEENNDLVIITGLGARGGDAMDNIYNKTVAIYYDDLGRIYEKLIQFITIIQQQAADEMYPQFIGEIIFLMTRLNSSVFDDIYSILMTNNEDIGYQLICECIARYYEAMKNYDIWKELRVIRNGYTKQVLLDFWLFTFVAISRMQRNEYKSETMMISMRQMSEYDEKNKTSDLREVMAEMDNIVDVTINYAMNLINTNGIIINGESFDCEYACKILLKCTEIVVLFTNDIRIAHQIFEWKKNLKIKMKKKKSNKIAIVTWQHDTIINDIMDYGGYSNICIQRYDVQYKQQHKKGKHHRSFFSRIPHKET